MPPKCVISTCQPKTNITVFNFPIQKEKREKWLEALNLDLDYDFQEPTGVCELHFNPSYIRLSGSTKIVVGNAIPDLQPRIHPKVNLAKASSGPNFTATVTHQNNVKFKPIQSSSNNNYAVFTAIKQLSDTDKQNFEDFDRISKFGEIHINPEPQPDAFNNGTKTTVTLPNTAVIIPQQLLLSNNNAVPTLTHLNIAPIILQHSPSSTQKVLVNNNQAVPIVTHLNSPPITVLEPPNNNADVVIKMEIDDETPQPNSVNVQKLQPPIALPMIEPDSIKIEVENPESDISDPLDTFLDRIENIQKRNNTNAALQAEMKECKIQITAAKSKLKYLKRNLKTNAKKIDKKIDKQTARYKEYNENLLKFGRLKNIYLKPELKIPKLMYDRFGMGEFDGLKYPDDLKQFAIELYSKSPVAYDYVRESLCKVIPHPDAILRWTKPPVTLENEE